MLSVPEVRPGEAWDSPDVDTWRRLLRKQVLENRDRITTSVKGLYDQTTDTKSPGAGGGPLDAATNYEPGDYYILSETGVFITPIPELNGLSGGTGDWVVSDGAVWQLLNVSDAYLSSVLDDSAAGVITFNAGAKAALAPSATNDLTRKDYVDDADGQHAALQADPDDVHGTKTYTDLQDAAHVADPNPHDQYMLESDALQIFSYAAYAGAYADPPVSVSIGGGWEVMPWTDVSVNVPRGASVDLANNSFTIALDGIWKIDVTGTFGHNDSNQGRFFYARFFNVTTGTPGGREFRLFTGRNSDGTPLAWSFLSEITEAQKGDEWRIEFGNATGSYLSANWQGEIALHNVGEWREPLPSDPQQLLGGGQPLQGGGQPLTT